MITNELFAIKQISINKFHKIPKLNEFTSNEITILQSINNKHIIKLIEFFRTNNNVYLVYEFCNGGTLEERIKSKKIDEKQVFL